MSKTRKPFHENAYVLIVLNPYFENRWSIALHIRHSKTNSLKLKLREEKAQ